MNVLPSVCYLCGKSLSPPISRDHVPPRQLYVDGVRRAHSPNLRTIPVHKDCNLAYQYDEDYFVNTLAPFARGSYAGDALLKDVFGKYEAGTKRDLVHKVIEEFDHRPSGIVLPPSLVVKRLEGKRVHRVAWKIIRGLYFHHYDEHLPEWTPSSVTIVPPNQQPPQELFIGLAEAASCGQYPGVFDYRFAKFSEAHNLNYWAMLFWDRVIVIVTFHDPACYCEHCTKLRAENTTQPL